MLNYIKRLLGFDKELLKPQVARSSRWEKLRNEHLLKEDSCRVCGGKINLIVHHIIPVHIDKSKELDDNNLMTLCEGAHHLNCHLLFGHFLSWISFNSNVREDVVIWAKKIKERPYA